MLGLDYEYYAKTYGGEAIPECAFLRMAQKAAAFLNSLTLNRASKIESDTLKKAACALAELYYQEECRGGRLSEDNDGYRIAWEGSEAFNKRLIDTATAYLANSGLLYRGMSQDV
jgi:hypothetical protein